MNKALMAIAAIATISSPALSKPNHGHGRDHSQHAKMKHHGIKHHDMTAEQHKQMMAGEANQNGRAKASWCPPGLAKRDNGCVPPGQVKRTLQIGQTLPRSLRTNHIPQQYQGSYVPRDGYAYGYSNGVIYEVDRATRLITNIITPRI